MSSRRIVLSGLALSASLVVGAALAREAAAPRQEPPKPTPHHGHLKLEEGTWDAAIKFTGPDGVVQESKGTEVNRMACGGLFLISDFKGEFFGAPFEGHGVTAYDPAKKKYLTTWCDSMGAAPMYLEGTCDADGKVRTMKGDYPDETGKVQTFKEVAEITGKDSKKFTMSMKGDDGEFHSMMTIEYKRKK